MLRRTLTSLVAALSLGALARGQSVEDVIARSVEARGGLERLRAVQSVRMTGRMSPPGQQGPTASITLERKRPRSSRFEFTAQGVKGVQGYDGRQAWGIPPGPGARPEALPEEMARDLANQADIDGPLVDYKAKGHKVELVGREKLDGKDAWRLLVRFKSGDVLNVLVDAETYLEIGHESRRVVRGNELEAETRFSDYREAGGVLWPHTIEVGPKGRPEKQLVRFEKVEVNPAIDDARFKMPRP